MKFLSTIVFTLICCILLLGAALPVLAAPPEPPPEEPGVFRIPNILAAENIQEFIYLLLDFLMKIGAPIVVLLIVIGGLLIMISEALPQRRRLGMDVIKWAIIGYAIVVLARFLVPTITGIFS